MRKIFLYSFFFILFFVLVSIIFLTTIGYETDRFNPLLEKQINSYNKKIVTKLKTIKVKANLRNLNFFITTEDPEILFNENKININKIDAYLDLKSLLRTDPNIKKIHISTRDIDVKNLKNVVKYIKPSNYKKFILNNLNTGKINMKIDLNLDEKNNLENYELNGVAKNLDFNFNGTDFNDTNFIFFITTNEGELSNLRTSIEGFQINTGNIRFNKEKNYEFNGDIVSDFKINGNVIEKYFNNNLFNGFSSYSAQGKLKNSFTFKFDNTLKIKEYNILSTGELNKSQFNFPTEKDIFPLVKKIKSFQVKKSNFEIDFKSNKQNSISVSGKYRLNDGEYQNYNFSSMQKRKSQNIEVNFDFDQKIEIPILNYKTDKNKSTISSDFIISKNKIKISNLDYRENKNSIEVKNLEFENKKFKNLEKIKVKTFTENKINNNFQLDFGKQIKIKGAAFDASNLSQAFDQEDKSQIFNNISKKVNVSLEKVTTKFPEILNNFNLIGEIKKGEFTKISSKGEFTDKRYLDISVKRNIKTNKNILEIYSDIPEPLLSNYKFFKGLSGGILTFSSEYDREKSLSKLVIENFKVKNAPGFVKLLSLADLGGMVDAISGDGLSFDKLEMIFEKDKKILNLKELYAIGPSLSVLMEGYIENKTELVSLRGTMVPAKTLNKMLSKIPVVGDIIIPKEIGEGLFGISFKLKGTPGKIKTSVNPIKTLTPRFIQKALNKTK